jgi:two-component system, OmpR family, response regulator
MTQRQASILIIDDEERIRRLLTDALEDHDGFAVRSAASAEEALDMLAASPVDLAIVDMRLPGMDGETFIVVAHTRNLCQHFLLHSGSIDLTLSPELHALGMVDEDVLHKPSSITTILERIRALLGWEA